MRRAAAAAVAILLALPATALAQACPRTTLGDVEKEVMCPVCGTPLELATEAPQANAQRAFIEERVARCDSKDEIKDALVAEFGPGVLSLPEDEGFDLAAYLVPILAVLGAGAAIAFTAARWRRARPAPAGGEHAGTTEGPEPDPDDSARLEADMRRYEL